MPCVFCQIANKEIAVKIAYEDDEIIAFSDRNPVAKYHYLVVPKEHLPNINDLTRNDIPIKKLVDIGNNLLDNPIQSQTRMGFHKQPFNSIEHLHLHVIYPTKELNFIQKIEFKPRTFWFITTEDCLQKLNKKS